MSDTKRRTSIHAFLHSDSLQGLLAFQQEQRPGHAPSASKHDASLHDFMRSDSVQQLAASRSLLPGALASDDSNSDVQLPARLALSSIQDSTADAALPAAHQPSPIPAHAAVPISNKPRVLPRPVSNAATIIKFAADVFGIDVADEPELLALAAEAHRAPVDLPWLEYKDKEGYIYYFNSRTKDTSWEHPSTGAYRERLRLKQLELRSQIMSARVLSARASHRSAVDSANQSPSAASHLHHQSLFLNLGSAVRISSSQPVSQSKGDNESSAEANDEISVIASTAQFSSVSQLLYIPNAAPSSPRDVTTAAAPPAAKILAMKTSSLDVSINNLQSLDGLAAFSGLVQLCVQMNRLTSLQHLASAPFLLTVLASKNLISSLSLDDIFPPQLQYLDLSNNRISDASALAGVPSLTVLNLSANKITAISGFHALTNLHTLSVANNSLVRMAPSTFAASLHTLDVHGNGLADARSLVMCLGNLKNLHSLIISQNPVEKVANLQVDVVAAVPSLKELNHLVIKQGFREELQLAAVSGIIEDASQRLKMGYLRAIEREQQRLQQCISSTKLKETFYEKAFDGYKKKLEAEFGAAIHRVQSLSTDAVASGDIDTLKVTQEASAVMHAFAQAANATGDFGRAVASDVFAHSSNASVTIAPYTPLPLPLRSFDAVKEAAIYELSAGNGGDHDGMDEYEDAFPIIEQSATAQLVASDISAEAKLASATTMAGSPRASSLLSSASTGSNLPSSAILPSAAPAASVAQRQALRPRPLSPKPSAAKALRSLDSAVPSALVASSTNVASAPAQPSPQSAHEGPVGSQEGSVRASSSCITM